MIEYRIGFVHSTVYKDDFYYTFRFNLFDNSFNELILDLYENHGINDTYIYLSFMGK